MADRLLLKPNSATGLVERLEALGLVTRQVTPEDRRSAVLLLTDQATVILEKLSETHREEIKRLGPILSAFLQKF